MEPDEPTTARPTRPILVVSPDLALREQLYDLLARNHLPVITVHSDERGLSILKHDYPGLILVDTRSPDHDSSALIHAIRSFDHTLPIIMVGQPLRISVNGFKHVIETAGEVPDAVILAEVRRWMKAPAPPAASTASGSILVVDDEPKVRQAMSEFLQQHGFEVLTASSGEEALDALAASSPQLVLLDIKLPGMDGLLTLKKMKALRPAVPVAMLTGLDDESLMAQAYALGALDYVTKPVDLTYLESLLRGKLLS